MNKRKNQDKKYLIDICIISDKCCDIANKYINKKINFNFTTN